jgi:hypothetical protein
MTRRHMDEAARIVAAMKGDYTHGERAEVARRFAQLFQAFNPNFDHTRFMKACDLP